MEPAAAEPLDVSDPDASFAEQPSADVEDDFAAMTLEECLALAPDQGTDPEPIAELEPPQWRGIAWPVLTRLACTILLALAGALGFRWLSVAPAEPREGHLVVQESFAQSLLKSQRHRRPSRRSRPTANRNPSRRYGRLILCSPPGPTTSRLAN